jgi:hypothetical protein
VHCATSEEIKRAKEVLDRTGAEDVSSTSEASSHSDKSDREAAARAARGGR